MKIRVTLSLLVFGLAACGGSSDRHEPQVCTTLPTIGIYLKVYDDRTRSPISTATGSTTSDTGDIQALRKTVNKDGNEFYGAENTFGTYQIRLEAPGYRDWAVSDVVVQAKDCGVETVNIEALMAPL